MPAKKYRRKSSYMDPVLSRGIISVLLIVLAILISLSFFGSAGVVGIILNDYVLSFLFGVIRFTTPLVLLAFAWFMIRDLDYDYRPTHLVGAVLFFLTASSLFHVGFDTADMWIQSIEGNGGGIFGMAAWPLKEYLGGIASIIILIGLVVVSILLIFNTAITHFILFHKKLFATLGFFGRAITDVVRALFVPKNISAGDNFEEEDEADYEDGGEEEDDEEDEEKPNTKRGFFAKNLDETEDEDDESVDEEEDELTYQKKDDEKKNGARDATYMHNVIIKAPPSLSILSSKKGKPTSGDIKENGEIIKDTFRQFKIDVDIVNVCVGPSVTQFSVKPAKGVKLSRITALNNNLALNLAAHPIRIEAPIPGKALVGIEVPNQKVARVTLKELLEDKEYTKRPHDMMLALGKDVAGKTWFMDLTRLPHLLVAGATGSGKTVCINTMILSLLFQNTAETLRMILVDPKRVELVHYNGIPHLLTPVITDVGQTVNALKWTIGEMERRFEVLAQAGNRDIGSYNKKHPKNKLPYLIFVIDELADLMATASNQVEPGIIRLAQMSRAVGIHLIVATQRPSVDVITGLMKANIPGRIAFSVASLIDSRTILDASGAEKLLGRGDMLIQTAELSKPVRLQGAFISEDELQGVASYLRGNKKPVYDKSILEKQNNSGTVNMFGGPSDDQDPLFNEAKQIIVESDKASASFLQRRMKIGYARAARILDELEEAGIVGPADGAKPRDILITETEISTSMDMGQELNVFDDEDDVQQSTNYDQEEDNDEEDTDLDDEDIESDLDDLEDEDEDTIDEDGDNDEDEDEEEDSNIEESDSDDFINEFSEEDDDEIDDESEIEDLDEEEEEEKEKY